MELAYALLGCNAVWHKGRGLNIEQAGINVLCVDRFPGQVHPSVALVAQVHMSRDDLDHPHVMKVDLWDADGPLCQLGPGARPELTPAQKRSSGELGIPLINMIIELDKLKFPHFGCYEFRVIVDDVELGIVPLGVTVRGGPDPFDALGSR